MDMIIVDERGPDRRVRLGADYSKFLFSICRKVLGNEDAEEAANEALHKIIRSLHLFDPAKGDLLSWTARIAHHHAVDIYRKKKREPQSSSLDAPGAATIPAGVPEESGAVEYPANPDVKKFWEGLGADHREILKLRARDYSYPEIAGMLGKKVSAVKMSYLRTLRRAADQAARIKEEGA